MNAAEMIAGVFTVVVAVSIFGTAWIEFDWHRTGERRRQHREELEAASAEAIRRARAGYYDVRGRVDPADISNYEVDEATGMVRRRDAGQ